MINTDQTTKWLLRVLAIGAAIIILCWLLNTSNTPGTSDSPITTDSPETLDPSPSNVREFDYLDLSPIEGFVPLPGSDASQKLIEITALLITSRIDHHLSSINQVVHDEVEQNVSSFIRDLDLTDLSEENLSSKLESYFKNIDAQRINAQIKSSVELSLIDIQRLENALSYKLEIAPGDTPPLNSDNFDAQTSKIYHNLLSSIHGELRSDAIKRTSCFSIGCYAGAKTSAPLWPVNPAFALTVAVLVEELASASAEELINRVSSGESRDIIIERMIREGSLELTQQITTHLKKELYEHGLKRMRLYQPAKKNTHL